MVHGKPAFQRERKRPKAPKSRVTKPKKFHKKPRAVKQSTFKRKTDETELMQRSKAHRLTLTSIRKGMLLLGCVTQISTNALEISLPGGTRGIVPEKNISAIYSKRLRDAENSRTNDCLTLNDLYAVGDLVYAKVQENNFIPDKPVVLTLDPCKLHEKFELSQLVPGLVLAATIIKEEDHGFKMELGVRNVLAFLPRENLNENRDDVGRNLFCSIVSMRMYGKLEVTLKAFHPDEPRVLNVEKAAMETIVPGCQLTFTVGEPVEYGLRGMLFEDSVIAYVNENMLTKVTSSKEKYSMFKRLPATLLYRMPVTNEVYVSLRPYPNNRAKIDPAYSPGTIIENACVKSHDVEGNVWLQLENKRRALLSRRAILNDAEASSGGNVDESVVLSNFQVGTIHKVEVVFVDPLENTYVVNKEKRQIDLKLKRSDHAGSTAQLVKVTVTCVHAKGVNVRDENGEQGKIAADCFSEFGEHNSLYMRLLREGETLSAVKIRSGQYSVRSTQYFQENPTEMAKVRRGTVLKVSCVTVNGRLHAVPTLRGFTARIPINDQLNYRKIEDGTIIKMRVVDLDRPRRMLKIRTKDVDVCEDMFVDSHCFMTEYLEDVSRLIDRYRDQGRAFAQYSIGDQVECVVEGIVPEYNKMAVAVDAVGGRSKFTTKGIVTTVLPERPASSYSVGQKLSGRVVWIDVEKRLVHVCVDEALFERIMLRKELETVPNEERECWILFTNYFINVCCVKDGPTCPLVIVPAKYHYNDFKGNTLDGHTVTAHLKQQLGSMIFGLDSQTYRHYKELNEKILNPIKQRRELMAENKIPTELNQVRCPTVPTTYDAPSDEDEEKEETESSNSIDEDEQDMLDDDGESDEEPTKLPISNGNGMQKTKNSSVYPSKMNGTAVNGNSKKLNKDELNEWVATDSTGENLLQKKKVTSVEQKNTTKKKKKEEFVSEELEMKEPKTKKKKVSTVEGSKKKKASTVNEPKKGKCYGLNVKAEPFTIDQLDGAANLHQLDGTEDTPLETTVKRGAKRRRPDDIPVGKGLPGATNFWDTTPVFKRAVADSSDDEADSSEEGRNELVPKKRTTAKERFEAMKQEEERLRKIEEELANPSVDPHTPDQFDRLVLAQPNNSMLWIRYMAFHMESAELEKARAVGRKALKAIHFREEGERLNVWIALLNLEIRYETVGSFKDVLQEAIQYNDAFKVYTRVVDILIDCQKHAEVQELLELLLKKFRKHNDMWFLVADAWYRIGQGNKVKPLLSQALKSLPTREHIPLIVKFAFLHNRNENRDEAHLLFEQVLTTYPKRTDIWSQYVDMLVKDNLVENARQILERAIMQRLPMKNMKTLYTKYVNFDEKHGDRERVRRVKQLAAEYVQAQLNNAGI